MNRPMPNLGKTGASLLFLMLVSGSPPPKDAPKDLRDVKEWWCTFTVSVDGQVGESRTRDDGDHLTSSRRVHQRADGTFHLNIGSPGGAMTKDDVTAALDPNRMHTWLCADFQQPVSAIVNINDIRVETYDSRGEGGVVDHSGQEISSNGTGRASVPGGSRLVIDFQKKLYGIDMPYELIESSNVKVIETTHSWRQHDNYSHTATTNLDGPKDSPAIGDDPPHDPVHIINQPLPDGVDNLVGSMTYTLPMKLDQKNIATVVVTWFLSPKPPPDVELVLLPADEAQYDSWRPMGALKEEEPGAKIAIVARLQKKGGGAPEEKPNKFTFKLDQVSHEPGVCINYPLTPKHPEMADLQFLLQDNPDGHVRDDHTLEMFVSGDFSDAQAVVSSFDYGAFGIMEATCQLESGRVLTAHLKTDPDLFSLRLPKSRSGSHIAEVWRKSHNAQGDDSSDDDDVPVGDGNKGDGFTLFEEYRGYISEVHSGGYSKQEWSDLDPNAKDFFIINNIGGSAKPAIQKFASISKLHVHELKESETVNRVVNFNHGSAWRVDQHAVLVTSGCNQSISVAIGGPGTPKDIQRIVMIAGSAIDLDQDLPHELLHCCNVWHHGEWDIQQEYITIENDSNGKRVAWRALVDGQGHLTGKRDKSPIKLFREAAPDQEIEPPFPAPPGAVDWLWVGMPHGQHSGDEDCYMGYHAAWIYPKGPALEYFWVYEDQPIPRTTLCTVNEGHLVNQSGRAPRPRYCWADIISKRGRCALQICVNDAASPPKRPQSGNAPSQDCK